MKPDIRPVSILTRAILDTSPAWVLLTAGNGYIYPSAGLRLDGALLMAPDGLCFFDYQRCYPCEPLPPFEPLPWPVLLGEEIPQWESEPASRNVVFYAHLSIWGWADSNNDLPARPGFRPSPRSRINADGSITPVWVWEADQ